MSRRPASDRERHAVRAILLSPDAHVLMMRFVAPDRSVWITPGGGLLEGERINYATTAREYADVVRYAFHFLDGDEGPIFWKLRRLNHDLQMATVFADDRVYLADIEDDAFELDVKISLVLEQGDPAGRLLELAGGYRVHLLVVGPDPELDPARLAQFSPIPIVFVNDSKEV